MQQLPRLLSNPPQLSLLLVDAFEIYVRFHPPWWGGLNLYIVRPLPIRDDTREMAQEAFFPFAPSTRTRVGGGLECRECGKGFVNYHYIPLFLPFASFLRRTNEDERNVFAAYSRI